MLNFQVACAKNVDLKMKFVFALPANMERHYQSVKNLEKMIHVVNTDA